MTQDQNPAKDKLFAQPRTAIDDFAFDVAVARVFPDMIRRSIPGYGSIINMIGVLAGEYAQDNSNLYDLGCSLGAATLAMRHQVDRPGCGIIAVDKAPAMVDRCRQHIAEDEAALPVEVVCGDIAEVAFEQASLVVLNFTLQFVPPTARATVINRIYQGLLPGGCLLLSEKITFDDADEAAWNTAMHASFKKANGYSELEISQKREALERVLIPDTLEQHLQRLGDAGFDNTRVWFRCLNFISLAAIKP